MSQLSFTSPAPPPPSRRSSLSSNTHIFNAPYYTTGERSIQIAKQQLNLLSLDFDYFCASFFFSPQFEKMVKIGFLYFFSLEKITTLDLAPQ